MLAKILNEFSSSIDFPVDESVIKATSFFSKSLIVEAEAIALSMQFVKNKKIVIATSTAPVIIGFLGLLSTQKTKKHSKNATNNITTMGFIKPNLPPKF